MLLVLAFFTWSCATLKDTLRLSGKLPWLLPKLVVEATEDIAEPLYFAGNIDLSVRLLFSHAL